MTLPSGAQLGPYEIVSPLGAGGMGEVYRAKDTRLDRDVAIKVLPERTAREAHALSRFRRETKALAALSHPNILMILDIGEHKGTTFAVMELLEGETLSQRLQGAGVDVRKALEIAAAVADGLAAAHARDIVHRDLKPANLILTRDGVVKILDFGLARTDLLAEPGAATLTATTQPGVVLGTVNYMSPEQVRADPADRRADIFSLGCVLYEMLTGQPPFLQETSAEVMTAILRHHPQPPSRTNADVPPDVDPIVMRCLEKAPEDRFHSVRDLAFSLRSALARSSQQRAPRRTSLGSWVTAGVVGLMALAAGVFYASRDRQTSIADPINSIAVLPFVNASGDPEQEYFVDGMTEALIADLAKIRALKVISRTSAMQFKGAKKALPQIAQELNVEAVVEGSVLRVGNRVRITAQLIHAPTDEHLWAESYERELHDVLRLHSELARTIAHEIQVTLTPQEHARMIDTRPINPEAHQAYLKGRFYWNKRTPDGVKKAVDYFEQAVALAPDWPLAYSGLADAYVVIPQYGSMRPNEAIPKARAAAAKALEMDESLAEAHATIALVAMDYDWNWPTAEREFRQALSLRPNYATGHHWYSRYLLFTGRYDEAIKEITKAQELDPLSLIIGSVVGMVQIYAGNLEQAETGLRKTLELGPDFAMAHMNLGLAMFHQGRLAEGISEVREAARLSNNEPLYAARLGHMCAKAGQPEEARRILDELAARSAESYVPPTQFAFVHAGLDERDQMFEWLEKAFQGRDSWLLNDLADPLLASMRSDPRFVDLVRRVGLPPLAPTLSTSPSSKFSSAKIMLAVLPFENISRDPEQDYFSDGLTDEMIAQLGRLNPQKLGVIGRTSAMRYKGSSKGIDQIGRELGVGYLLEGTVRRAAERLRITAKLVQVSDQTQLWSQEFDRTLEDVLAVQADVADKVARSLALELLPETKALLARTPQIDRAVHDLYLRGRFYWYRRTPAAMLKGIDYFNQVLKRQPEHARAYAALADSYNELAYHGHLAPHDAFPRARAAAQKAVALDDTLAEPHASLAFVAYHYAWDWPTAERELQRAIELNPSYADAHHLSSHLHMSLGRVAQSLESSQRALAIDPLEMLLNVHLGWHYLMARQYDLAAKQLRETIDLDRGLYPAHLHLGRCYLAQGLFADAVASLEEATRLAPESMEAKTFLAAAYAASGRSGDAQKKLDQLKEASQRQYVSACDIATVYSAWGKVDDAFTQLQKALEERSPRMVELTVEPIFDPLRSDPRFADLVRRVGLPNLNSQDDPMHRSTTRPLK